MPNDALSPDELISAYLDGDATAEQIQRVEADPQLVHRAQTMSAAIKSIGAPVDSSTVDFGHLRAVAIAAAPTAPVIDLAAVRARRAQRLNRLGLVAAAFVLLAVGTTIVRGGSDNDSVFTDASAPLASDDKASVSADLADAMAGDDMASSDTADSAAMDSAAMEPESVSDDASDALMEESGVGSGDLSLLPDQLPAVPDIQVLQIALVDITSSVDRLMLAQQPTNIEQLVDLCPALVDAVAAAQPGGTHLLDSASVDIGGQPATVVVAIGNNDTAVAFVGYGPTCDSVQPLDPGLP